MDTHIITWVTTGSVFVGPRNSDFNWLGKLWSLVDIYIFAQPLYMLAEAVSTLPSTVRISKAVEKKSPLRTWANRDVARINGKGQILYSLYFPEGIYANMFVFPISGLLSFSGTYIRRK